ncbi:hypothetical protein I3842_08G128900 [Carya illinoinensis]|uniref:Uncharacterized protein n=1 Tax=Carya illinoinensis TaxID=32201 RepID=A0A922EBY7_CARIL|nr:hypothetical protein I3842_08G128900 [Carya illinoinensis]
MPTKHMPLSLDYSTHMSSASMPTKHNPTLKYHSSPQPHKKLEHLLSTACSKYSRCLSASLSLSLSPNYVVSNLYIQKLNTLSWIPSLFYLKIINAFIVFLDCLCFIL